MVLGDAAGPGRRVAERSFGPHHTGQIRATTRHGMRVYSPQSKYQRAEREESGRSILRLPRKPSLRSELLRSELLRTLRRRGCALGRTLGCLVAVQVLTVPAAWAGTGGPDLPWNDTFGTLLDALTGTTGRVLAGLMLVAGGIVWGFVRHEEGARRFAGGLIGIALVFGALQVVDGLAFAGGLF